MTVLITSQSATAPVRAEPKAVLELFKPVTWFPPMWAFACGAISAGTSAPAWKIGLGILVAGPLVCGTSQAVNDWFDRHVDAVNEPHRPIPSGRLPGRTGLALAVAGTGVAAAAGALLGTWGWAATLLALLLAWGYSAPPFRFKANGWVGNAAVGFSYEGLAWVTGAAVLLGGALPPAAVLLLAALYSIGAHGIMTLNDYKSQEGDRAHGVRSLPVLLGPAGASRVACAVMAGAQLVVVVLLLDWGHPVAALAVAALVACQGALMLGFLRSPDPAMALRLSAFGVPFYVSGMMIAAFAVRGGV